MAPSLDDLRKQAQKALLRWRIEYYTLLISAAIVLLLIRNA